MREKARERVRKREREKERVQDVCYEEKIIVSRIKTVRQSALPQWEREGRESEKGRVSEIEIASKIY